MGRSATSMVYNLPMCGWLSLSLSKQASTIRYNSINIPITIVCSRWVGRTIRVNNFRILSAMNTILEPLDYARSSECNDIQHLLSPRLQIAKPTSPILLYGRSWLLVWLFAGTEATSAAYSWMRQSARIQWYQNHIHWTKVYGSY